MILEAVILNVRPGTSAAFEAAFRDAESILTASAGYLGHELHRCLETQDRFLLLVRWRALEDHVHGFRGCAGYQEWKQKLHHFYDPFPLVEHYVGAGDSATTPWLSVPLADYEGHMSSPAVAQLNALSELFETALASCRPSSIAIFGIAGGNGLRSVTRFGVRRVIGIDINPDYLAETAARYSDVQGLELRCHDLRVAIKESIEPVELVHAALIFEHAGTSHCLDTAVAMVAASGTLSVVLQLPAEGAAVVSDSPFRSIQGLSRDFQLVDRAWLRDRLTARGLRLCDEHTREVGSGKAFWLGMFRRFP